MNHVVESYPLSPGINELDLPSMSEPLSVGMKDGSVCLWVRVPAKSITWAWGNLKRRRFQLVASSVEFQDGHLTFIGSRDTDHVFEINQ